MQYSCQRMAECCDAVKLLRDLKVAPLSQPAILSDFAVGSAGGTQTSL
jgi:hypothetical protein